MDTRVCNWCDDQGFGSELVQPLWRDTGDPAGDDDPVIRCAVGVSGVAVAVDHVHLVIESESADGGGGLGGGVSAGFHGASVRQRSSRT